MTIYLLKMSLCSAVLLLFYRVVLEREKMLGFNRFYLLGSLVVSLVLPLIPLEILLQNPVFPHPPEAFSASETAGIHTYTVQLLSETSVSENFSWVSFLGVIYVAVGTWLLVRFGKNLAVLVSRIRSHAIQKYEGLKLILLDVPTVPHSFLNNVFVSKTDFLNDTLEREIMAHERAHARQLHSLDILFIEFLKVIFWFNPALHFYRNAIAMNHEFLADEAVTKSLLDISYYQHLLLQKSASPAHLPFISKFNYSFIKKRFVMMHKQTSPARAALAQFSVLPLLAIVFFAFSDVTLAQVAPPPPPVERKPPPPPVERKLPPPPPLDYVYEYNRILRRYIDESKPAFAFEPSQKDGNRLEVLLAGMTKEQKASLDYTVSKIKPRPRVTPSEADFEKYKESSVYGVRIDDKKVPNTELNKYRADDFSQVSVSKLYPNAQKTIDYKYKYTVDLMTTDYYENYRKKTLGSPKQYVLLKKDRPEQ